MSPKIIGGGAAAILLCGTIVGAALFLGAGSSQSAVASRLPPATAAIVRTTLAETKTVTGTLSLGEATPVRAGGDAGTRIVTWMAPEGSRVERGEPLYAIDGQPVVLFYGATPFFRTLRFDGRDFAAFDWLELETAQDDMREAELSLELERVRLAEAESRIEELQARLEDSQRAEPQTREFIDLQGAVAFAQGRLESLGRLAEAGAAAPIEVQTAERNIATAHANLESAIRTLRQQLRSAEADAASGRAASVIAERRLEDAREQLEALQTAEYGAADVRVLRDNLAALGYSGSAGEAVRAWQADLGLAANGTIEPGQIVVAQGPIRIAEHVTQTGDTIDGNNGAYASDTNDGDLLLNYTGTAKLVTVPLAVADHAFAEIGRGVTVVLPDQTEVDGVISEVGAVVSAEAETEVTVAIPDQDALGALEAASVDVIFVSQKRENVLAVPITALLARPEGGFGVEIVEGTSSRIVPVTTGMFANGRVEISGEGVAEGMAVGVPG